MFNINEKYIEKLYKDQWDICFADFLILSLILEGAIFGYAEDVPQMFRKIGEYVHENNYKGLFKSKQLYLRNHL